MRPKLLDLFCCAGGAARGYTHAGFDVVGVDIRPQPNYPYEFWQMDALGVLRSAAEKGYLAGFSAVHASPPCQRYTVASKAHNGRADEHPDYVAPVRSLLDEIGLPYVIENVPGAPLKDPVMLCGTMFPGLRVIRHRLFETNWELPQPAHGKHPLVYTMDKRKPHYGQLDEFKDFVMVTGGGNCSKAAAADAMGLPVSMTKQELNEALPPAYTKYIGGHLLQTLGLPSKTNEGVEANA